jgi:hypothetical protein
MKRMTPVEQANQALQQVKDAGSGKTALELGWIEQIRLPGQCFASAFQASLKASVTASWPRHGAL